MANSLVLSEREADSVPTTVKNLRVQRFQLANSSVNASSSLRTLVLADHSGLPETRFELNGYRELQKLRIGSYCYRNETCSFSLSNCPKLKSIQIGPESFEHCKSFELKDFPSLQTVELGDENFFETTAITFKSATDWRIQTTDLPSLKSIKCGNSSFFDCRSAVFEGGKRIDSLIQTFPNCSPSSSSTAPSTAMAKTDAKTIANTRIHWS